MTLLCFTNELRGGVGGGLLRVLSVILTTHNLIVVLAFADRTAKTEEVGRTLSEVNKT